jgi:hypothetical protein
MKCGKFMIMFTWLICCTEFALYTKSACIIIHGTWAKNESWYQNGGDFFHEIEISNQYLNIVDEITSFSWSGKLGYPEQLEAAKKLVQKIFNYDFVILIGHSHGVTVGILASIFLGKFNSDGKFFEKIKRFYALGVPVDPAVEIYPDMSVIGKFYNLFSFGDIIQPVHGLHERCFNEHKDITNIAIQLDDLHPSHSELHHPVIGKHLLVIPDFYGIKKIGNFENFLDNHPAEIFFFSKKNPRYEFQDDQKKRLETDKIAFELFQYAFFRSRKDLFNQGPFA